MMTYPVRFPSLPVADLEPWRADALCTQLVRSGDAEPHWWFPTVDRCPNAVAAIEICGRCPVAADCLAWARRVKEHDGIWGGQPMRQFRAARRYRCVICKELFEIPHTGLAGRPPVTCSENCKAVRYAQKQKNSAAGRQERRKLEGVR